MVSVTFLGTAGGRYVMLSQRRYSGGIWLEFEPDVILDPGPGALLRALEFKKNPSKLHAVFVSHKHLDHYNDAEVMIEAMTEGAKKKKGLLVCPESVLDYVSDYHRESTDVLTPKPFDEFNVGDARVKALPTLDHIEGLGFRFTTKEGVVVYSSDTDYSEELSREYMGASVLILNVIFPSGEKIKPHLNTDKAIDIVSIAKPKLCVITHFGMQMLNAGPEREASIIEKATGIKTLAARDGQTIPIGFVPEKQRKLEVF
jgi:ribonuclease BN (tRNA processing enzyme)